MPPDRVATTARLDAPLGFLSTSSSRFSTAHESAPKGTAPTTLGPLNPAETKPKGLRRNDDRRSNHRDGRTSRLWTLLRPLLTTTRAIHRVRTGNQNRASSLEDAAQQKVPPKRNRYRRRTSLPTSALATRCRDLPNEHRCRSSLHPQGDTAANHAAKLGTPKRSSQPKPPKGFQRRVETRG